MRKYPLHKVWIWTFVGLCLSACQVQKDKSPSILVIAVDDLGFNESYCANQGQEPTQALEVLCSESIRFSHAFTTSTLSVPALTSLLTGFYPFESQVRTNADSLKMHHYTPAEAARDSGYRTAFFSGGAPVLRFSGLNQGFEVFEDNFNPQMGLRPFDETMKLFLDWLLAEDHFQPFFAVLYVPDLLHKHRQTFNVLGESRTRSYESQIEEFDETLQSLMKTLKAEKRWDNTLVILAGLSAPGQTLREREIRQTQILAERSQVTLMIKPPSKPRDESIHWSIDENFSLVDVGFTLSNFFKVNLPQLVDFKKISFQSFMTSAQSSGQEQRWIATENAWMNWIYQTGVRRTLRREHMVYLADRKGIIYNSLLDRFEVAPYSSEELSVSEFAKNAEALLESNFWKSPVALPVSERKGLLNLQAQIPELSLLQNPVGFMESLLALKSEVSWPPLVLAPCAPKAKCPDPLVEEFESIYAMMLEDHHDLTSYRKQWIKLYQNRLNDQLLQLKNIELQMIYPSTQNLAVAYPLNWIFMDSQKSSYLLALHKEAVAGLTK
ncbi:MAG: sulfatase-like hydrolase/transferase [Pseudobdellovibrionaceae bacterium]